MGDLSVSERLLLADMVASVEVLFWPFRFTGAEQVRALAAVRERRACWLAGRGVAWRAGGGPAERKSAERAFEKLAACGLVGFRAERQLRSAVTLPRFAAAHSIVPACSLADCWPLLGAIAEAERDPQSLVIGKDAIWEGSLVGMDWGPYRTGDRRIIDLEDRAWPLATMGLLDTETDACGLIVYSLTPAGRASMDQPPPTDDLGYDPAVYDQYSDAVARGLSEREQWKPKRTSDIAIPLSAGFWSHPATGGASDG